MLKTVHGTNALTVLVAPSEEKVKLRTKIFFCPYRKNIVLKYTGEVDSIRPGYDPTVNPQFFIRPQRQVYHDNINYIFNTVESEEEDHGLFWIQDQYFDDEAIRSYYCYNCQAPQLSFGGQKVVDYKTKKELKQNTTYLCDNCKQSLTYMGIVKIEYPKIEYNA